MTAQLWTWDALVRAAGGTVQGTPDCSITGVSIDTRTLRPGDLFVALAHERDGHEFVAQAFAKGAAAALVSRFMPNVPKGAALSVVDDTLRALERIGGAARDRISPRARIAAVTGSAGKTGTKDALARCLAVSGHTVHASEKSYNNHWGVPLTLALMPATIDYGVFEIGMNHAGEITPLAKMVRPHVAIITTVEPVHLAYFPSVEAIADAKAEIFNGLESGGCAVLNRDNPYFERLTAYARATGVRVLSFGTEARADTRLVTATYEADRTTLTADVLGDRVTCTLGAPGQHLAMNALAVLTAVKAMGGDLTAADRALVDFRALPGRGARKRLKVSGDGSHGDTRGGSHGTVLLIDESYNANPASMRAALQAMATLPRAEYPRRIAVLGDMLELGAASDHHHEALAEAIAAAEIDLVFACGPHMERLYRNLPASRRSAWTETSDGLTAPLLACVQAGDAVVVKGSLGSRMAPLVAALENRYSVVTQR